MQHGTKIILVQHYPIVKPKMVGANRNIRVDQETVIRMSEILREETARYSGEGEIVVWDSFNPLMKR